VSGVFKSFVASGNFGRSKHYRSVMVQYCGRGNIAGAEWRGHRGESTAARRRGKLRKYDSERRDVVPGFLRNRALPGRQVKNRPRDFTLELRGP
jgi:hypothetical protein